MYFSYVPSIIFSFFNRPLFLNLLFKQILIQYYSILFIRVLGYRAAPRDPEARAGRPAAGPGPGASSPRAGERHD